MVITDKFLINTLKRLILAWASLAILYLLKVIFFDYYFAPSEITIHVLDYEERNEISSLLLIIYFLVFIVGIISLFMIWKLKLMGRQLFLITLVLSTVLIMPSKYVYMDSLDYIIEYLLIIIDGSLLTLIYLSPISKKFK